MFHRFGGRAFFFVLTLMFFLLSIQNTWQFLVTVLPDSTMFFIGCMMIVFEGGFLGWLALLMYGTENIPRTIIAFLMLVVTGIGVCTGAYYELDGQMHKSIAVHIDAGLLAHVPDIVNGVYIATFIAIVLYILANPTFFARMAHMNATGRAPAGLHLIPIEQTVVEQVPVLSAQQPAPALPPPPAQSVPALPKPGLIARGKQALANKLQPQTGNTTPTVTSNPAPAIDMEALAKALQDHMTRSGTGAKIAPDAEALTPPPPESSQEYVVNRDTEQLDPKAAAPSPNGAMNGYGHAK